MSANGKQRPLQDAGFIVLALAAISGLVTGLEWLIGYPLWMVLLVLAFLALVIDFLLFDRSSFGELLRSFARWLASGLGQAFQQIWGLVSRVRGRRDENTTDVSPRPML
jgi:hypothetical protein